MQIRDHLHAVCGGELDAEEHPPHRLERAVHHGLRGTQGSCGIFTGWIIVTIMVMMIICIIIITMMIMMTHHMWDIWGLCMSYSV